MKHRHNSHSYYTCFLSFSISSLQNDDCKKLGGVEVEGEGEREGEREPYS